MNFLTPVISKVRVNGFYGAVVNAIIVPSWINTDACSDGWQIGLTGWLVVSTYWLRGLVNWTD